MKCQNCNNEFIIDSQDKAFYDRIQVPEPTFCPQCRFQRRFMWRNTRALYKRKNDFTGGEVISTISQDKPYKVYDYKTWWSDDMDALQYGRNYDFNKPFFEQYKELLLDVPKIALFNGNAVNAEYCSHCVNNKNCYLSSACLDDENIYYSNRVVDSRDCRDVYIASKCELCYENALCENSSRLFFSLKSRECLDSFFLYDCRNCTHCFCCTNLRNKQYHIFNKPYTKEEYFEKLKQIDIGSYANLQKVKEQFQELYLDAIHRFATVNRSVDSTGDNINNAKNCIHCFNVYDGIEDCKYMEWAGYSLKDTYDGSPGVGIGELIYEAVDTGGAGGKASFKNMFSIVAWDCMDVRYVYNCHSGSGLFGCVGIKRRDYCILNKQYTKEEYIEMVPKIIQHMNDMPYIDSNGRKYGYGEFFPAELSPFCYNETIAQELFPLTKEQAIEQGYKWKDSETKDIKIDMYKLPNHIKDVDDDILKQVIECEHKGECNEQCTQAFKIIPQELDFYRKYGFPLPRLCPNCRHYRRLSREIL